MKITVGEIPLELAGGRKEFEFAIPDPAVVCDVQWKLQPRLISMAADGAPQFDEVLVLFVQFSPGATQRKRRFVVIETGQEMALKDGFKLVHVGTASSLHTGLVAHVFEVKAV